MQLIKLRATETNPKHAAGELYEVAPIFAASDVYLHRAVFADDADAVAIQIPAESTEAKKRTYKRRDMKAES